MSPSDFDQGADDPAPGDRDLDAAEYVLGLLPPDQARVIETLAAQDAAVAASIVAWQNRLGPLADAVSPLPPPPELWQRLALATGLQRSFIRRSAPRRSAASKVWRSLGLWRTTTVGALALAAGMAYLALTPEPPPPEPLLAALSPQGSPGAVFLVRVGERGQTTVIAVGRPNIPIDRTLELWALREGATAPVSLGLLPGGGRTRLRATVSAGTRLLVSQEPTGGSPTGAPTGPVVYAGLLTNG
jgi:anti-sigma-K factor RskA